ncbi:hypothetical protein KSP40_PGU017878 [Platanthera guangdongensis]|uniref:Uncharacterized protein n=1 Tax=Platanthera guangdongensis TaxID=2320717 RepID=A0ABR2MYC1_9ASPA
MARDNGGIPVPHEKVFTRTHRTNKGKGPFVDDKSKKAFEIYTSKLKEKQSDQSYLLSTQGSCIYYPELWVEASGGPKMVVVMDLVIHIAKICLFLILAQIIAYKLKMTSTRTVLKI